MANRRRSKKIYWGTMVLDAFKYLQDSQLGAADYRIFFYLCEKMDVRGNVASVNQKMISEDLSMDKSNVSKSISKLKQKQLIARTRHGFMINPHLFYIRYEDRMDLRDDFDELVPEPIRFNMNEDENELEEFPDDIESDEWYKEDLYHKF